MLILKARFSWEKKKHIKTSETSSIFWHVLRSAGSNFCATYNFLDTFAGFCSIMFTQVLMKELECILVRKTFNCRVSFKILLSMCLIFVEKEL